jgi:hypothetical protein
MSSRELVPSEACEGEWSIVGSSVRLNKFQPNPTEASR